MKPIPVTAARHIAQAYGYDQVVIIARSVGDKGGEHCTTYGVDKANCSADPSGAASARELLRELDRVYASLTYMVYPSAHAAMVLLHALRPMVQREVMRCGGDDLDQAARNALEPER